MDIAAILSELRGQRDRLQQAIDALERTNHASATSGKRRGRKPGRRMSAEARAKIAAGARRRWAAAKKAGKNSLAA